MSTSIYFIITSYIVIFSPYVSYFIILNKTDKLVSLYEYIQEYSCKYSQKYSCLLSNVIYVG